MAIRDNDYAVKAMRDALRQLELQSRDRRESEERERRRINDLMSQQTSMSAIGYVTGNANMIYGGGPPRQQRLKIEFAGREAVFNVILPEGAPMEFIARELSQHAYRLLREYPRGWSGQGEQPSENRDDGQQGQEPAERLDPAFE